jgi:hypothetical protein
MTDLKKRGGKSEPDPKRKSHDTIDDKLEQGLEESFSVRTRPQSPSLRRAATDRPQMAAAILNRRRTLPLASVHPVCGLLLR